MAPFKHGLLKQGLNSEHVIPEYPDRQMQVYDVPWPRWHVAPFRHGLLKQELTNEMVLINTNYC